MSNIYQFKITLNVKPKVWRRILVPEDYTFLQLHKAIQCSMGWKSAVCNYHLHQFQMKNPNTGEMDTIATKSETVTKVAYYFSCAGKKAEYEYDFGESWQHEVLLEKVLPKVQGKVYPMCKAGRNACPPEDPPEDFDFDAFDSTAFNARDVVFS